MYIYAQTLIEYGADLEATHTPTGATAMSVAAQEGYCTILEVLKRAGANIEARMDSGFTPLLQASLNGRHRCVETLIKLGAKVQGGPE